MPEHRHIFELDPDTLAATLAGLGMPRFRADQVLAWVYQHGMADPQGMTNLSKADRIALAEHLAFETGRIDAHQVASDGVQKLLIGWGQSLPVLGQDGGGSECVMIPTEDRRTACISSQVGCAVGCRFCASGVGGLERDLSAGQIVEQVWRLGRLDGAGRITHVVFMGMGEPLANLDQVLAAVGTLRADWGLGISARRITISTVGLPAQMRRLADQQVPVTLAISLHAPNDSLRRELIPWAKYVTIEQLLEAGRYYFARTGREVTLEYTLLGGVNDQPRHADELAEIAATLRANVNLIRYNPVKGMPFDRPGSEAVHRFQQVLRRAGINAHIRASRGQDIAAACGQLKRV